MKNYAQNFALNLGRLLNESKESKADYHRRVAKKNPQFQYSYLMSILRRAEEDKPVDLSLNLCVMLAEAAGVPMEDLYQKAPRKKRK